MKPWNLNITCDLNLEVKKKRICFLLTWTLLCLKWPRLLPICGHFVRTMDSPPPIRPHLILWVMTSFPDRQTDGCVLPPQCRCQTEDERGGRRMWWRDEELRERKGVRPKQWMDQKRFDKKDRNVWILWDYFSDERLCSQ